MMFLESCAARAEHTSNAAITDRRNIVAPPAVLYLLHLYHKRIIACTPEIQPPIPRMIKFSWSANKAGTHFSLLRKFLPLPLYGPRQTQP
jgi:hypothetical protein